jgi:leucyl aminopeptidase
MQRALSAQKPYGHCHADGACVVASLAARKYSGLFFANEPLAESLGLAAHTSLDPAGARRWMTDYDGLKTNFADVANVAGRRGAVIRCFTAICNRLCSAHLDIAGTVLEKRP